MTTTPPPDPATLPGVAHQHHDAINPHVDRLPQLAAMLGSTDRAEFSGQFERECRFVTDQLVPHMEAIEGALYERLEAVMEGRHSMAPMRDEHALLRRLISSLCGYRAQVLAGDLTEADEIGLRRVLYRLYAILKVHLAEEEQYLAVLDHALDEQEKERLARGLEHAVAEPL
jgi:hypothetical protein